MHMYDDPELKVITDTLIQACDSKDIKITIAAIGESEEVAEDGSDIMNYSSAGNMDISSLYYPAMYADYANDLMAILPKEEAARILDRHMSLLTEIYWANLKVINEGSH